MNDKRAVTDILAGLIFVAFGLAFAATSLTYELGTPLRMGPGYFPLVLGGILVVPACSSSARGSSPAPAMRGGSAASRGGRWS